MLLWARSSGRFKSPGGGADRVGMSAPGDEPRADGLGEALTGHSVIFLWIVLVVLVCVVRLLSPTGDLAVMAKAPPGSAPDSSPDRSTDG